MEEFQFPRRLRIAGKMIEVRFISKEEAEERGIWGTFVPAESTIYVADCGTAADLLDTILHEVLHALYYVWNLNDEDDEERTVHTLASALQAIFVDNKQFYKAIGRIAKTARTNISN